ncbi:bifunctional folylpolyglutamate synthase/dihydrofolate synthase [Metabacillus litoralis]|jgi:dihydrofolate synthase / folylpolyglutamate synthase|uniref:bifunctional folylpolyglutamate synthase/dihydrofolate synthase n=1 Tax=Metabacillus litoralis TaxID=152268 RepID=UPI0020416ECA|nr:folylpolyglutamate synthase/dihydrofolate synthase family protein [Metabacillus litoralis]MCM3650638.1 bifunctional folylpolyglutamate synthase/dihydrofolate synthase [Metabacillus litoralis]
MFKDAKDAIDWIHSRLKFGVKPGLKRMEWLLEALDNPHKNIPTIHVAGTNGKGSTVSYMLHMLTEAGYKVGTFTSPYIETFNERISVNGQPISDQDMLELVNELKPYVEELEKTELDGPTEFEIITTMMFLYFGTYNKPDFLLLETGLGGRLDSTNIVEPILSIITNVGYDHMNILGETIEEIASEKAGIMKENVPVITGVQDQDALAVIRKVANERRAPLYRLGEEITIIESALKDGKEVFSLDTPFKQHNHLMLTMKGEHQIKNAALAITALDFLKSKNAIELNEDDMIAGLEKTIWKGRFETISKDPLIILDGAHNLEGVESLIQTVKRHYEGKRIHILFSALADKEFTPMINQLQAIATSMTFTSFDFPRAAKAVELYHECTLTNKKYNDSWVNAIEEIVQLEYEQDDVFLVTGSLYFISEVRNYLINDKTVY